MGLWTLLEGFLLLANALAILNEDRFLAPRGWSMSEVSGNGANEVVVGPDRGAYLRYTISEDALNCSQCSYHRREIGVWLSLRWIGICSTFM